MDFLPLTGNLMKIKIVSYLLAVIFFASGLAKLLALQFEVDAFLRWGFPIPFMYLAGVIEVAGAFGLLINRLSSLTALCLGLFMLGAIGTHIIHKEWPMLAAATSIACVAYWLAWLGRAEIKRLLAKFHVGEAE